MFAGIPGRAVQFGQQPMLERVRRGTGFALRCHRSVAAGTVDTGSFALRRRTGGSCGRLALEVYAETFRSHVLLSSYSLLQCLIAAGIHRIVP
jgi:hypothetical protein